MQKLHRVLGESYSIATFILVSFIAETFFMFFFKFGLLHTWCIEDAVFCAVSEPHQPCLMANFPLCARRMCVKGAGTAAALLSGIPGAAEEHNVLLLSCIFLVCH